MSGLRIVVAVTAALCLVGFVVAPSAVTAAVDGAAGAVTGAVTSVFHATQEGKP